MKDNTGNVASTETRRLAAIMFTDIVGFSRQMGSNEARMLRLLEAHNRIIQQTVVEHHGKVIKTVGDAFLVDFPSVVHAVQCAQQIQAQLRTYNADKEPTEQIHVRIGIHSGDIVHKDGDVFGDGVNTAKRLQEVAEPDTICISDVVYRDVAKKLELGMVVSLGRPKLKNIAERFQVYALLAEAPRGLRQTLQVQRLKLSRRVGASQRVVVAILLLALVSVGAIALRERYFPASPALPLPDNPSVAVLPFVNRSGDAEQEYFSDGMTDTLITDLSAVSGLFVIARDSAFTYKGRTVKVQDISRVLGVRYVVEGSVQKAGDRARINIQLIDATTGGQVWAERYDRELKDIFALQDEISQKIVQALAVKLTQGEQARLGRKETNNLEAYEYFWRGEAAVWHFTKETNLQAQQLYKRALELDPEYAAAYAGLAQALGLAAKWGWDRDPQTRERATELAWHALALDATLPTAHHVLAGEQRSKGQHDQAIAHLEKAVALAPNDAYGYACLGEALAHAGRPEEGIRELEKAVRLNPHSPPVYLFVLGQAYALAGRYEEALTTQKRVLVRWPHFWPSHLGLAIIYTELDRHAEARAAVAEALKLNPQLSLEAFTAQKVFYKDPVVFERELAALRKAGLQ